MISENVGETTYQNENVTPKINGVYKLTVTAGGETKQVELDVYSLYAIRMWELDVFTDEVAQGLGYENVEEFYNNSFYASSGMSLEQIRSMLPIQYKNAFEEKEFYEGQVNENGGFYIGRYEASNAGERVGCKPTTNTSELWNNISQTEAITNIQSTFQGNNYTSSLLTGSAWDRTLCWLYETGEKSIVDIVGDSKNWGNYYDDTFSETIDLIKTGSKTETRAKNIYDLAGNLWEWTSQADGTDNRVGRGRLLRQ